LTTPVIPILRMFDEAKAKQFYLEFLGFRLDWEHRYESGFPLYMQVSLGEAILHLSEHHGDCTPGAAVRIESDALEEQCRELNRKNYSYAKPGIQETPWNMREMTVTDPFGNRLVFYERSGRY
jgi:hypothetical protein